MTEETAELAKADDSYKGTDLDLCAPGALPCGFIARVATGPSEYRIKSR